MIKENLFNDLSINQKLQFLYYSFKEIDEEVKYWLLNEFEPYFEEEFSIGYEIIKDIEFVDGYLEKLLFPTFNLSLATEPATIGEISLDVYTKELSITQNLDMLCRSVKNDAFGRAKAIISLQLLLSIFAVIRDQYFTDNKNNLYSGLPFFSKLLTRVALVTLPNIKINALSVGAPTRFNDHIKYYVDWENLALFTPDVENVFPIFFDKIYNKISV